MRWRATIVFLFALLPSLALAQFLSPDSRPRPRNGGSPIFNGPATANNSFTFKGNNSYSGISTWTAALIVKVRSSGASTVTASATTDYFFCLDPTSNAIALNLPASPTTGLTYLVKDCTGQAGAHNITVTPNAGNIDGSATFVMSTNYQSIGVTYTGSQWSVN